MVVPVTFWQPNPPKKWLHLQEMISFVFVSFGVFVVVDIQDCIVCYKLQWVKFVLIFWGIIYDGMVGTIVVDVVFVVVADVVVAVFSVVF